MSQKSRSGALGAFFSGNGWCARPPAAPLRRAAGALLIALAAISHAQTAPATRGLDAFDEDALMNEVAGRGMTSLLDRAMSNDRVPPPQQKARRALMSLNQLADPAAAAKLSAVQREELVRAGAAGLAQALPALNDASQIMRQAFVLITQGIEPQVNTLEYWGPNPRTQAALQPIVQITLDALNRAADRAHAQADDIANQITSPTSPAAAQYDLLEKLAGTAEYTRAMVQYDLALSLDAASPQRKQTAADASDYLKQFDVADNPDRGIVRNRLGKLALLAGDLQTARGYFTTVFSDAGVPPVPAAQQYEARYFLALTELSARDPDAADKAREALQSWSARNLPSDAAARKGADAAAALLSYRIESLRAELARDPSAGAAANQQAVATLMDLLARRPELRPLIYEQLLPRLPENADLHTLDPLLLRALVSRGERTLQQRTADPAATTQPQEANYLQRALEAAQELQRRRLTAPGDEQTLASAALLIPFFQQGLGRPADAAASFVDYAEKHKAGNLADATLALDNAQGLIGRLRAADATRDDPVLTQAYEKFLPLAIGDPFDRTQFAYEYARRLQLNGNDAEALKYFKRVPESDRRHTEAQFGGMVALKQQIETLPPDAADRTARLRELQTLADSVSTAAGKSGDRALLARTLLLAADLARREQKDPTRALALLNNFESRTKGVEHADALVNEALYVRVLSYMALSRYDDATHTLVALLNKTQGGQGAQIVYNLLQRLNADLDRAQEANDVAALRTLAANRAQLSTFLVGWAEKNPDEKIRKYAYRYRVFDADSQRLAGELGNDRTALQASLKRYQELQQPENVAQYKASLDSAAATDTELFDPQVLFGLAQTAYDLADYKTAADGFSRLITARKLGTALIVEQRDGIEQTRDNDRYWEAILKLIRCDQKLNVGVEDARNYLERQYILWGEHVGGRRWKAEFDTLRKELIPDFIPAAPAKTPAS